MLTYKFGFQFNAELNSLPAKRFAVKSIVVHCGVYMKAATLAL